MLLKAITLRDFRNYTRQKAAFGEGLTVIYGDNAQGKTNLLEGIYICSAGRSHRTNHDQELVREGQQHAYIRIDFEKEGQSRIIELLLFKNGKKQIKLDGAPVTRIAQLLGCFNAVLFWPDDLCIVKDGPSERRRFMDVALCQTDPLYYRSLCDYQRALMQRNALLKDIAFSGQGHKLLQMWEDGLARHGAYIIEKRREYVLKLAEKAGDEHCRLSGSREKLDIKYASDIKRFEDIEDELKGMLKNAREDEVRRGVTTKGPHKDDFDIVLNGFELRAYGSQGQQRTAVLALRLAQLKLMEEQSGDKPVMLLDDVLSELDETRRNALIKGLGGFQTILTCTEPDGLTGERLFVENGTVAGLN